MRRDLVVATAALVLGLVGLGVGAVFVWAYVVSPLGGPYDVPWQTADVVKRGHAVTITYEQPCGSSYSHTDTEREDGRLVLTVHVEGRGLYCSAEEEVQEVTVRLRKRVDPATVLLDGSYG